MTDSQSIERETTTKKLTIQDVIKEGTRRLVAFPVKNPEEQIMVYEFPSKIGRKHLFAGEKAKCGRCNEVMVIYVLREDSGKALSPCHHCKQ